jgi:7-carboxy-7-deazaguanine synthase
MKIFLAEKPYKCLQGEGSLAGMPSILIRTSGCNLRCEWIDSRTLEKVKCDTPYTSWESSGELVEVDEIVKVVLELAETKISHVILSGGEPLMIKEAVVELCEKLWDYRFHITIETNGTFDFGTEEFRHILRTTHHFLPLFSISPKLGNSVPNGTPFEESHNTQRINYSVLKSLTSLAISQLKFVVMDRLDMTEVCEIVEKLKHPKDWVFLMPEGRTYEQIRNREKEVYELALEFGFRYSPRLHIQVYDDKRLV